MRTTSTGGMRVSSAMLGALTSTIMIPILDVDAKTIRVPQDAPTIQSGVLAGTAGDTVLVAPGRYAELIRMKEGIYLKAEAESTVLVSPELGETPFEERLIECLEGIGRGTVIEGFIMEAGSPPGCAVYCENGSPTIRGNRIDGFGWGINLRFSKALVEGNTIENCRSFGLLIFASEPEIYRNTIRNNRPQAINISGKESHPIIGGSRENANKIYSNGVGIVNQSRNDINATYNDWGWEVTAEMEGREFPADISAILDGNDEARSHRGKGSVDYRNWIQAEETAAEAETASGGRGITTPLLVALAAIALLFLLARSRRPASG